MNTPFTILQLNVFDNNNGEPSHTYYLEKQPSGEIEFIERYHGASNEEWSTSPTTAECIIAMLKAVIK